MQNLTFEQFNNAEFKLFEGNPILKNPLNSFVIADPSLLTPDISHDGKWHLFCHTFFGVYRYESEDGISLPANPPKRATTSGLSDYKAKKTAEGEESSSAVILSFVGVIQAQ